MDTGWRGQCNGGGDAAAERCRVLGGPASVVGQSQPSGLEMVAN